MARVTVEDCLEKIPNRFQLCLIASERTKQLLRAAPPLLTDERSNKEAVLALREIAEGLVTLDLASLPGVAAPEGAAGLSRRSLRDMEAEAARRLAGGGFDDLPPAADDDALPPEAD